MSKMGELIYDISVDINTGALSWDEIALKYSVPAAWVAEIAKEYSDE